MRTTRRIPAARAARLLWTWPLVWALAAPAGAFQPTPVALPASAPCASCHTAQGPPHADPAAPACVSCHGDPHPDGVPVPVVDTPTPKPAGPPDLSDMVLVPAGPAVIGNDGRAITEGRGNLDETPRHTVDVGPFLIDRYEVTNTRYARFVEATGATPPRHWKDGRIPEGKERHPVVYVSWFDADAFCRWEGKRLPGELEWEKAARGGDGRTFPWGDTFSLDKANTPQRWASLHEDGDTMPVGSFEAGKSPYGLYDMAGNVWEWTRDWYKPYPGNRYPNGFYGEKNRVLKGGSWYDCLSYGCGLSAPSYNRSRFTPKIRNNSFGFRCAADVPDTDTPRPNPAPAAPVPDPERPAT